MKLAKKNLFSIIMNAFVATITFFIAVTEIGYSTQFDEVLKFIGGISIVSLIITLYMVYRIREEINYFIFFLALSYFFYFGQCILIFFGYDLDTNILLNINHGFFSSKEIYNASMFTLIGVDCVCIGYCLVNSKNYNNEPKGLSEYQVNKFKMVGWIFLLISIVPKFYLLYVDINILTILGYGATLKNPTGIEKIMSITSGFFPSSTIILYLTEKNQRNRYILYFVIVADLLLELIGGSRIDVFRYSIIFFLISNLYHKNLSRRASVVIAIMGLVGLFALSLVSKIRTFIYLAGDIETLILTAVGDLWQNNFLVSAINEMGNTQIINTLVFTVCPTEVDYAYGSSFLKVFWSIIPNFWADIHGAIIGVTITFSPIYTSVTGLGGSYISEGYWNFGYFSIVYFVLFGAFLGWIVEKFRVLCNYQNNKVLQLFVVSYIMYFVIYLIRSEWIGFGRNFVYYVLIPIMVYKIKWSSKVKT